MTEPEGFEDWLDDKSDWGGDILSEEQIAMRGYRAGMLEAARIARLANDYILDPKDIPETIAKQIEEWAGEDQ